MKCPTCNTVMFVVEYDGIELDVCQDCRGVWFDRGELDLLLGDGVDLPLVPTASDEARRDCPICDTGMGKMNIGPAAGVMIDVCPAQCGLWFDGGEVGDLAAALQGAGSELPDSVLDFLRTMFPADASGGADSEKPER